MPVDGEDSFGGPVLLKVPGTWESCVPDLAVAEHRKAISMFI